MCIALMLSNKGKIIVCKSVHMVSLMLPISWIFSHIEKVFIITGLQDSGASQSELFV